MTRILIVDDEERIRSAIREYIEFEEWEAVEAKDGMEAVELSRNDKFDIIIMDIMMPRLDGYSACKEIRKRSDTPVLMLSARGEEYDKLFGFELGVDDYVVKPFSGKELIARIKAILQRSHAKLFEDWDGVPEIQLQGLVVDFRGRKVIVDHNPASLTPKEYDLLFFLIRNRNIALSREQILSKVWGYDYFGDNRTVDAHIKMLRSNLGPYRKHIVTLRGMGYKFEA
ncbi:MAG: response regulator transcription factor [Clostridiaceae bacterium]|nr:response regulator transcription factor [Clostridiaceae bacterium]